jgi:signal transduction histidine kinase
MKSPDNITLAQFQALYKISQKINSQLNLSILLDEIMDLAIELVHAEKGLIFLRKEDSDALDIRVARTKDRKTMAEVVEMSRSIVHQVFKNNRSEKLELTPNQKFIDPTTSMFRFKITSILCVPLRSKSELLGVIYLDTTKIENLFGRDDLLFLEAFANLAGVAIDNARNYQQLQFLNQNLEELVEKRTSELKETQLQLIQAEKMASLGRLAAGISHEVNNPLSSMNSNNQIFSRSLEKLSEFHETQGKSVSENKVKQVFEILDTMKNLARVNQEAGSRIQKIVNSLRNFARLDESEEKKVDIHEGINNSLKLIQNFCEGRINIMRNFCNAPPILCKPGQLNQVFMNLLLNACESIEGEGQIQIKTRSNGNKIEIEIKDSGKGITPENLNKIFDPGFTTKSRGVGTGLGLSICYQIIEDHGGNIEVISELDKGSTFVVSLPLKGLTLDVSK